ncbi:hypothetical protein STAQ_10290 [Allostella sp. ATCC 35155]|nr:hypothetical protein STAQ_10290 [Stella sp. ATCC 35155]
MLPALARATGLTAVVSCLAWPAPALAQPPLAELHLAQVHGPAGSPVPEVRTTRSAPRDAAEEFARKATIGNMFEIETSRLALERSRNPDIRAFAQRVTADHGRLAAQMLQTMQPPNRGVATPDALDEAHARKLATLREAEDDRFDRLYLQMQVEAHEQAVALHGAYAEDGEHVGLRSLAATAKPIVEEHLRRVRELAARARPANR